MPLREYRCRKCGRTIERLERMTESAPVRHAFAEEGSRCGGLVERLMSMTGAPQFRGSGFYATDYKQQAKATR